MMHNKHLFSVVVAVGLFASPAAAQLGAGFGYDGEKFVAAVRDRDGGTAIQLLEERPTVVNSRDAKGDTALIIAIARRDSGWTGYLLKEGADVNLPARNGETPLIAAARVGFPEAVRWLLARDAKVDLANRMGETPLIVAVQGRHTPIVKLLLGAGADPDKPDSAAGYSARDYARRDTRSSEILKLIEAKTPKAKSAGL